MSVEPIADKRLAEVRELLALGPGHIVPSRPTILSILARLDKAEGGWKDISTAPKDGNDVLLWYPAEREEGRSGPGITAGGAIQGWWHNDPSDDPDETDPWLIRSGWETVIGFIGEPTYWMPFNPPPSKEP
jgi:hypothetical protein